MRSAVRVEGFPYSGGDVLADLCRSCGMRAIGPQVGPETDPSLYALPEVDRWLRFAETSSVLRDLACDVLGLDILQSQWQKRNAAMFGSDFFSTDWGEAYRRWRDTAVRTAGAIPSVSFGGTPSDLEAIRRVATSYAGAAPDERTYFGREADVFRAMTGWPEAWNRFLLGADPDEASVRRRVWSRRYRPELSALPACEVTDLKAHYATPDNGVEDVDWRDIPDSLARSGYELILIHDVLDHLPSAAVAREVMRKCRTAGCPVYCLCHPRRSRLGTHLDTLNLAYLHLAASPGGGRSALDLEDPLFAYSSFFDGLFDVVWEQVCTEPTEPMFREIGASEVQYAEYLLRPTIGL